RLRACQGAITDRTSPRSPGAVGAAARRGTATALCLSDPSRRWSRPDVQRQPGAERVLLLRQPLRQAGRRDRPVGGPAATEPARGGAGVGEDVQPGGRTRQGNREEARLTSTVE